MTTQLLPPAMTALTRAPTTGSYNCEWKYEWNPLKRELAAYNNFLTSQKCPVNKKISQTFSIIKKKWNSGVILSIKFFFYYFAHLLVFIPRMSLIYFKYYTY